MISDNVKVAISIALVPILYFLFYKIDRWYVYTVVKDVIVEQEKVPTVIKKEVVKSYAIKCDYCQIEFPKNQLALISIGDLDRGKSLYVHLCPKCFKLWFPEMTFTTREPFYYNVREAK